MKLLMIFFSFLTIIYDCRSLLSDSRILPDQSVTSNSYPIGLVLDMGSSVGRESYSCISMAISEFHARNSHSKTRLVLYTRDSMGKPLDALFSAIDLLQNERVEAIIGPQTSEEAEFLVDLGEKARVPILTFSATSPFLSQSKAPYFVRVAANDNAQVKAIAAIVQAFKWKQVTLIHEDSVYGNGVIPYLVCALEKIDSHVPDRSVITSRATDDQIVIELQRLMTMSTRVFVVHMSLALSSRFFLKVKELGMMSEGYAWIVTYGITSILNSMDYSSVIESMQGVIGLRPYIPPTKELEDFTLKRLSNFPKDEGNIYCLWAYDVVWAIGKAAEKVGPKSSEPKNPKSSSSKFTNLDSVPVSETGPKLLTAILESKFHGLSGKFQLMQGELQQPLAFQMVNIIGNGAKGIGFWTLELGISKVLSVPNNKKYSASLTDLEQIVWPGGSKVTPKGWIIMPVVSGKKLRIGVPMKNGFTELVKVDKDEQTGAITAVGFCIDVFEAAVAMLPYALSYEFIPWMTTNGTYSDLVFQVYLQALDAVVGDVTITANRSQYVDFTLPFTELGVGMVMPIETGKTKSMWIFLEPLKVDLWLVSGAFCIVTGCVVWVIEHKINDEFKGSTTQQVGTVFWYSFSTLVFAQREKLRSNLSKFVVIVWLFAVLILTSSYTASLSSLLTVGRLQTLKKGSYIGYQNGFSTELLNNLNFENSTLKSYKSAADNANALIQGSTKGGVSAVIDEIPYIKLFLAKYGRLYTMIEPAYSSTNGFGFVFPKGSPLASDFSRAIARLREDSKLDLMEQTWFQDHSVFKKQESPEQPSTLNSYSFRGLFLVTAISSALALVLSHVLTKNEVTSTEQLQAHQLNNGMAQEASPDHGISAALADSDYPCTLDLDEE